MARTEEALIRKAERRLGRLNRRLVIAETAREYDQASRVGSMIYTELRRIDNARARIEAARKGVQ